MHSEYRGKTSFIARERTLSYSKYIAHYPALLKLGIPIMLGQFGTIVMGFADTLMIGHHSTQELAAAGFANNIFGLVFITAMGYSYGLTPVVGALMGEGNIRNIAGKLKNSIFSNLLVGLFLMLIMGILYLNLHRIGLPEKLQPTIRPYYITLWLSILPQMAFNGLKQFSDAIQDTKMPMWILLGSNLLNILGNWILIFGMFGLPEMGLLGAGIATLVSRIAMFLTFAIIFQFTCRYQEHRKNYRQSSITRVDQWELNKLGWPVALQLGMESASFSLSAIYIGWLGTNELAAHQIMITISQLCFMLYYGMAAAVAVEVSFYRGANEIPKAKTVALSGLQLTWILGLCTTLPIFLLRSQIGGWFTDSAEVSRLVSLIAIPLVIYQFGDGMQSNYANALRGMADVKPMIWIAFIAYFIISLPLGYFFGFVCKWELVGVWMAFPFGLTSAGIMYMLRFHTHKYTFNLV